MKVWRRTEPRIARPFFAMASLGSALQEASLLVGDKETEILDDVVQLDPADFEDLYVAIQPNCDADRLRGALGDRSERFSLILTIRDPMFKRRLVHEHWNVAENIPCRIPLPRDIVHEYGHGRELHISIAVALTGEPPNEPGWPDHKGAWVAKRTFKIKLRSIRSTFDLRPMGPEEAKARTGYAGALLAVDLNDSLLATELDENENLATVYIAQEIYDAMQRATDGPLMQNLVIAEVIETVLAEAAGEIVELEEAPKGTPIATILEQLGQDGPMPLRSLKEMVKDPERLKALIHDRTGFVRELGKV